MDILPKKGDTDMAQAWLNIHHDEMMTSIKTLSVRTDDTVRTVLHVAAYNRRNKEDFGRCCQNPAIQCCINLKRGHYRYRRSPCQRASLRLFMRIIFKGLAFALSSSFPISRVLGLRSDQWKRVYKVSVPTCEYDSFVQH